MVTNFLHGPSINLGEAWKLGSARLPSWPRNWKAMQKDLHNCAMKWHHECGSLDVAENEYLGHPVPNPSPSQDSVMAVACATYSACPGKIYCHLKRVF